MSASLEFLRRHPQAFAIALAIVLLLANVIAQPRFADLGGIAGTLATFAPFALVAVASMPSIISGGGGIDISVGPLAIVVNTVLAAWLLPSDVLGSPVVAIPIVLALGALVGLLNGLLVAVLRFQPVIATLCMSFVLTGLAVRIAPSPQPIASSWVDGLTGSAGPIPGALLTLLVPIVIWIALGVTNYRRSLFAVGANDATALSAGVAVAQVRIFAYTLGGLFAAVAGIAFTALVRSAQAGAATSFTLTALAAVALGGTSLAGGRGGMVGVFAGAASIYLIQTLLSSLGVPSTWQQLLSGLLLIAGVVVGGVIALRRPTRRGQETR